MTAYSQTIKGLDSVQKREIVRTLLDYPLVLKKVEVLDSVNKTQSGIIKNKLSIIQYQDSIIKNKDEIIKARVEQIDYIKKTKKGKGFFWAVVGGLGGIVTGVIISK